ncbi:fimbrial biogenesis outer membrane usher protein [Serratia nevei]|nr:fimbria/pilus outer membrane usher protein [Serratia marcescens]BEN39589.1 hypothetical protein SMKC049_13810 [Serratia marcescens]
MRKTAIPYKRNRSGLWMLNTITLALLSSSVNAQEYTDLPAAPRMQPAVNEATYYLRIVVNGQSDQQAVPVIFRQGHYAVEAGTLARNHIKINEKQTGLIDVDRIPGVKTEYDSANQQLKLTVPDSWLPLQAVSDNNLFPYTPAQSSPGLLFNYDAYYLDPNQGASTLTTWLEQRFFNDYGMLSNTGTYRSVLSGEHNETGTKEGYIRYDTYWRYSNEKQMVSYQLGDFVSNSLTWSNSARMGGLRIGRNFGVRPDLVTYPLMQYTGSAAVPSTVDLFINGYKSSSNSLNSGPFTLTNVPYINGAGEATVVTTDALGRQVSTSVPFYVSNILLRQGLSDFDISLGAIRKNYGIDNADYSNAAFSGIYRYGLNNSLTLSSHTEAIDGLTLAGLGSDIAVGRWGTFSNSYSQSYTNKSKDLGNNQSIDTGSGNQYTLGYSYYSNLFSISAQHAQRSHQYQDLTSYTSNGQLSKQSDQVTFSTAPFGQGNGTLGLGYFDIRAYDSTRTRLANLSYSRSLWGSSSLYLSLNKTVGEHGYSAQMQLIVPLDSNITATGSVQRDTNGDYSERLTVSRSAPTDGGMGWNVAYAGGHSQYRQADATWKTQYATVQGGVYGGSGQYNRWADLSGSLIYMDSDLFATNKINDAFIIVSTDNYAKIPVKYENQLVGETNKNGHVLVPWVSSYYPAKVEINTLDLPVDVETPKVEQRIAVREGSGTLVTFPVKKVQAASITLVDLRGTPLPVGTQVTELGSGQNTVVGYGGQAYFSNLQRQNEIRIQLPSNDSCQLSFKLPESNGIAQIGPLTCPINLPTSLEPQG